MRIAAILCICAMSVTGMSCATDRRPGQNAATVHEIEALRQELADSKAKLAATERKLARAEGQVQWLATAHQFDEMDRTMKGPDIRKLQAITLQEYSTRDEDRKYIQDIVAATKGQHLFSSVDPQVVMLLRVGPDRLNLLIDGMEGDAKFYFVSAITALATNSHKRLILDSLAAHPDLVEVVLSKGWEQDAKEILTRGLAANPEYLPPAWIEAVAHLKDPKTYDALKVCFMDGYNKGSTYKAIAGLPGMDLSDTVAKTWEKARAGGASDWQGLEMAGIAMEYGHPDAVELLVNWLAGKHTDEDATVRIVRKQLLLRLPVQGSNEEIVAWYNQNKNTLAFDPATKKFVIFEKDKAK